MTSSDDGLLSAERFGLLWFGAGAAMGIHAVGSLAGWWTLNSLTWWIALVLLLAMSALGAVDYYQRRLA